MTKKSGPGRTSSPPDRAAELQPSASPSRADTAKRKATAKAKPKRKADKRGAPGGRFKNPPFVATAEQRIRVEAMVAAGAQQWLIAEDLGLSEDTLQRHFRPELDEGKHRAISKIGGSMVQKALNGDQDAAKFVLARIGGWKSTTAVENSGPNGGPMQHEVTTRQDYDFSGLTIKEKRALETLLGKAKGDGSA